MLRALSLFMVTTSMAASADAIEVALANTQVMVGRGEPQVKVSILEPIAGFKLNLTRSDGKAFEWKGGGRPGVTRSIVLEQPLGRFGWKGTLVVNFPNGSTAEMPLEFETQVAGVLKLIVDKDKDVNLDTRTITFSLTNPAGKAELKVLMESGEVAEVEVPFAAEAPGTRLSATWPERAGKPLKVSLKVFDTLGVYSGVEFFPWSFEIPHDDVVFDSGKWDLRADQQSKVDEAAKQAIDAIRKFGQFAQVTFYVAGHTDTVGATTSNRTLSLNRARTLAQLFRKKGVSIPIRYEGFGEEALAVGTDDETAEERNRRAQYIISVDAPRVSNARFAPRWQKL